MWDVKVGCTPKIGASKYRFYVGGNLDGEELQPSSGNVIHQLQPIAADGDIVVEASSVDANGNESARSEALTETLDHEAPPIPDRPFLVTKTWVG